MNEISVPAPDAAGYFHFTYITTDPLNGCWYGGKRSTKKHPITDSYRGSGNWVRSHPERERLRREIVAFYATSKEVFAAEAELITLDVVFNDPLCMNLRDGGEGVSVEAALLRYADPERRAKHADDMRRMHADPANRARIAAAGQKRATDPKWQKANAAHMKRMRADPITRAKAAAVLKQLWADPGHVAKMAAANQRMTSSQEWKEAHRAGMQRAQADPVWQQAMASKNSRMASDPKWRAANLAAARTRSADSTWIANHGAAMRQLPADPAWLEKNATGLRRIRAILAAKRAAGTVVRCDTIFTVLDGKRVSLRDACRQAGVSYQTAYARRERGWLESDWLIAPTKR